MKNNKTNFSENISREDITNFQKGQDIELNDDFDKDSMDGWRKNNSHISLMEKLDKRYSTSKNTFVKYTIYIGAFILIISSIFIYSNSIQTKKEKIVQNTKNEQKQAIEKTDLEIPNEISSLKQIPKKGRIVAKTIKMDFSNKKTESLINDEKNTIKNDEKTEILTIETKEAEKINKSENSVILEKRIRNAKEMYIKELLLVDYRKYRNKPSIKVEQIVITGLPANFEKKNNEIDELDWKQVDIPYIDYVTKTIELFSKGNYKKSLIRFEEILKTYPEDLNANFYGGLCYYNLGEFQKANDLFEKCLSNEFTNFNQEAFWYVTKTLISQKEYKKAALNLNQIISENEFYSEQAKISLKKLQNEKLISE